MLMTITEFAEARNTDRDTVNAYIRKHPEIKEFVKRQGKNSVIDTDTEAFSLLEKQYPLPQMIQIIEDTESRKQLIKAQEVIIQLQSKLNEQSQLIARAEATQILLDDKTKRIEDLETKAEAKDEQIQELQNKLNDEISKSWIQKLFGK